MLQDLPSLLAANGPLLFFVAYQVFFNAVGWPTWGAILTAPFLIPLLLGIGLSSLLPAPTEIAPVAAGAAATPLVTSTKPASLLSAVAAGPDGGDSRRGSGHFGCRGFRCGSRAGARAGAKHSRLPRRLRR